MTAAENSTLTLHGIGVSPGRVGGPVAQMAPGIEEPQSPTYPPVPTSTPKPSVSPPPRLRLRRTWNYLPQKPRMRVVPYLRPPPRWPQTPP